MNCRLLTRTRLSVAALLAAGTLHAAPTPDDLRAGFENPPVTAKPQTLWFWLNGNISQEGITRDLEAMKRLGLAGAMIFEGGVYIPRGPVDYLSPTWRDALTHTFKEADRLGLQIGMHNAPGWSSSGGPWITPELSMKQLVWTEMTVAGGSINTNLLQPYTKEGFYRDAMVLAFPALPGEEKPYQDKLKSFTDGQSNAISAALLTDGDLKTGVKAGRENPLVLEFAETFEARAITLYTAAGAPIRRVNLESSKDGTNYQPVLQLNLSPPRGIEFPAAKNFPTVKARFFRLTPQGDTTVAEVALHRAPRIEDWNYKGNFAFRIPVPFRPPAVQDARFALDPKKVQDISARMDAQGRLKWDAPPGAWVILRLGYTSTGQRNVASPAAGYGLECDKFSREAVEHHFQAVQESVLKLAAAAGTKSFVRVEIDSYEAEMQNWTGNFPQEFKKQNNYDLLPYLPALTGRIVGDTAISERFLFDVRRTESELMAGNYFGRMGELCREHGLQFYVEPYGPGPYDELSIASRVDVPMTEFWTRFPWGPSRVVKSVSSSAHIYGKSVVAAEAFTGEEETSRWQEYPYAMKTLGDLMFSQGYNQTFFHRYAHQPHPTAAPGMTMGPWGIHLDRENTWFDQGSGWMDYLGRSQYLLQQGNYVADVLYFVGERSPEASQYTQPVVPAGYNYDLVNADVLLHRVKVSNGRIVLPEGGSYRVLQMPDNLQGMTPELLNKLEELISQGLTIIGPKPTFCLTLRGGAKVEGQFQQLAETLWAGKEGHNYGRGQVFVTTALPDVLKQLAVAPDFEFTSSNRDGAVAWLHRQAGDTDIYFVANRQRRTEDIVASLRATGRQPEIWDAETGRTFAAPVYAVKDGRTQLPLHLEPAQSVFVVLRRAVTNTELPFLARDGVKLIEPRPFLMPAAGPEAALTNTFTLSVWVKPDINLRLMPEEGITGRINETAKNYVVPAPEGNGVFGPGHALMGLAAGRNGVYVVERSSQKSPAVLVAKTPLAGWTHLAVVYDNGKPSLYINGKLTRVGLVSGDIVHPAVGVPSPGMTYYFEGDMTEPEVFDQPLRANQIVAIAAKGLPPTELPAAAELALREDRRVDALVWESGSYQIGRGTPAQIEVSEPVTVTGPWQVSFPPGRGASNTITLPELMSLHLHSDPGVRYFSGIATYSHPLTISPEALADGRRVYLDLGRVEVTAEVSINGRKVGQLWKAPYRLDITGAVHAGENSLEVRVANLWPNRLIGDESLPVENEYDAAQHNIERLPDWYAKGEPKPPGGRTSFATWKFHRGDEPLQASGLLGPVRVLNPVQHALTGRP